MDEHPQHRTARLTRRGSLARLGGLLATGIAGWQAMPSRAATGAVASGAIPFRRGPEQTEGPYYLPDEKVRRNITEGRPGTALLLRLGVVDASTCTPIRGAAVDIWHCDALGVYSGVAPSSAASTFMRGIQRTSAAG